MLIPIGWPAVPDRSGRGTAGVVASPSRTWSPYCRWRRRLLCRMEFRGTFADARITPKSLDSSSRLWWSTSDRPRPARRSPLPRLGVSSAAHNWQPARHIASAQCLRTR